MSQPVAPHTANAHPKTPGHRKQVTGSPSLAGLAWLGALHAASKQPDDAGARASKPRPDQAGGAYAKPAAAAKPAGRRGDTGAPGASAPVPTPVTIQPPPGGADTARLLSTAAQHQVSAIRGQSEQTTARAGESGYKGGPRVANTPTKAEPGAVNVARSAGKQPYKPARAQNQDPTVAGERQLHRSVPSLLSRQSVRGRPSPTADHARGGLSASSARGAGSQAAHDHPGASAKQTQPRRTVSKSDPTLSSVGSDPHAGRSAEAQAVTRLASAVDKTPSRDGGQSSGKVQALTGNTPSRDGGQGSGKVQALTGNTPSGAVGFSAVPAGQGGSGSAVAGPVQNAGAGHNPAALPAQSLQGLSAQLHTLHQAGGGHASLQLNPPSLGHVHIQLQLHSQNQAQISFTAAQPDTAQALQSSLAQLNAAMQQNGIHVAHSEVNTAPGSGAAGGTGHPGQQGGRHHREHYSGRAHFAAQPERENDSGVRAYA